MRALPERVLAVFVLAVFLFPAILPPHLDLLVFGRGSAKGIFALISCHQHDHCQDTCHEQQLTHESGREEGVCFCTAVLCNMEKRKPGKAPVSFSTPKPTVCTSVVAVPGESTTSTDGRRIRRELYLLYSSLRC